MDPAALNSLHNFNCNNIEIKNSVSEKLLDVIIDKRFGFTKQVNTIF